MDPVKMKGEETIDGRRVAGRSGAARRSFSNTRGELESAGGYGELQSIPQQWTFGSNDVIFRNGSGEC